MLSIGKKKPPERERDKNGKIKPIQVSMTSLQIYKSQKSMGYHDVMLMETVKSIYQKLMQSEKQREWIWCYIYIKNNTIIDFLVGLF